MNATTERAGSKVLSLQRMSRRLGVAATWLKSEAEANRLPHVKAGNRYLFCPIATEDALADRASTTDQSEVSTDG